MLVRLFHSQSTSLTRSFVGSILLGEEHEWVSMANEAFDMIGAGRACATLRDVASETSAYFSSTDFSTEDLEELAKLLLEEERKLPSNYGLQTVTGYSYSKFRIVLAPNVVAIGATSSVAVRPKFRFVFFSASPTDLDDVDKLEVIDWKSHNDKLVRQLKKSSVGAFCDFEFIENGTASMLSNILKGFSFVSVLYCHSNLIFSFIYIYI